jgi:predicted enzyme related to lactoylglutathione lyase
VGTMQVGYVNVCVVDFGAAVEFFGTKLGLTQLMREDDFGYATFDGGPITIGVAKIDPADETQAAMVGGMTSIGLVVSDLDASYARLVEAGVEFTRPPEVMPWGGQLALMLDVDGNIYYLDQVPENHP